MSIHPWQILAGAAAGVVLGVVLQYQVGHDATQRALASTVDAALGVFRSADERPPPARPLDAKQQQRLTQEQAQAREVRDRQARELRVEQNKTTGSNSEALAEAARKERAWARYYHRPAQCDGNPNQETMIECANHHIRAKREFEKAYASGAL